MVKIITTWSELIRRANLLGKARITGNEEEIKKAEIYLKEYEEIVKKSDGMVIPNTR